MNISDSIAASITLLFKENMFINPSPFTVTFVRMTRPIYPWSASKPLHSLLLCHHCSPIILHAYALPCIGGNVCRVNMSYRHSSADGDRPANQSKPNHLVHFYNRTQTRLGFCLLAVQVCVSGLVTQLVQCGTTDVYLRSLKPNPIALKVK